MYDRKHPHPRTLNTPLTQGDTCVKKQPTSLVIKAIIRTPINMFQLPSDID